MSLQIFYDFVRFFSRSWTYMIKMSRLKQKTLKFANFWKNVYEFFALNRMQKDWNDEMRTLKCEFDVSFIFLA